MKLIGIGMDLVDVDRFRTILARQAGFTERVFTADERAYAERAQDPTERYAVRFAAKEAIMKAMSVGLGAVTFQDLEVVREESGAPRVVLHGSAAELAGVLGIVTWQITLSHTDLTAGAFTIALA